MRQRTAAKVDGNQAPIVAALRSAGATVWVIGLPLDLLVGHKGQTLLMEVKTTTGVRSPRPNDHTPLQANFLASWRGGPVATVTDVEGALRALEVLTKC